MAASFELHSPHTFNPISFFIVSHCVIVLFRFKLLRHQKPNVCLNTLNLYEVSLCQFSLPYVTQLVLVYLTLIVDLTSQNLNKCQFEIPKPDYDQSLCQFNTAYVKHVLLIQPTHNFDLDS